MSIREKIEKIILMDNDNDCRIAADKILEVVKEIVPGKKPLIMDSGKPLECGDNDIRMAINDLIDEILKRLEE